MSAWVIARREMAERRLVWVAAGYVALAGVVLPYLRGLSGAAAQDARGVLGVALNLVFVGTLAALLGAAMIPGDLASGRISFFLARPVSVGAVLWGRLLAGWLLAVGGGLVALVPQVALGPWHDLKGWGLLVGFTALGAIPLLLLGHVLGVAWRAKTLWVLLDFSGLGLYGWLVIRMLARLLQYGPLAWAGPLLNSAILLLTAALALAAHLQLDLGRSDLKRGHRWMSLTLAAGLLASALILGAGYLTILASSRTTG